MLHEVCQPPAASLSTFKEAENPVGIIGKWGWRKPDPERCRLTDNVGFTDFSKRQVGDWIEASATFGSGLVTPRLRCSALRLNHGDDNGNFVVRKLSSSSTTSEIVSRRPDEP